MSIQRQQPRSHEVISITGNIALVYDEKYYNNSRPTFDLFCNLFLRAFRYGSNPRNLEAYWKPMYSVWLAQMAEIHPSLACFQEQPIWWADNVPADADKSMTAGQGGITTLIPDIGVAIVADGKKDVWLLIGELKRSPKRAHIVAEDGLQFASKGWRDLLGKMLQAIGQVQEQAFVALYEKPDQEEVALFAASGPFWTYTFTSRAAITALFMGKNPNEVAEQLAEIKGQEPNAGEAEDEIGDERSDKSRLNLA